MMEGEFRIRVTYAMTGRLVMLSHLETARAIERTVRRSDLPFAVTQGFSPHMKLAFGSALPVGVGGLAEIFDVTMTAFVPPAEALARLRAASAPDLMPYDVRYIDKTVKAASVAYPFSTYRVELADGADASVLKVPEEIVVVRKKKERHLIPTDFLAGGMHADGSTLTFTLEAKPSGSLRPDVLVQTMLDAVGHAAGEPAGASASEPLHVASLMRVAQSENAPADGRP
ncbi:TIGR03936 family radical SAM-associated protein [Slackia exigua]|uniref:TIGR03936 family radical SAM-associated protein n=1 Tax=Slackia exigua TaxID=84109 RepID=UPI00254ABEEF|nr:TIGR03936 family radical SAM-associated protein [Slackia exigua]MDK7724659.1 TIGR03936 family radical SAM-associated protein [Slackia exigua]MDK7726267.1 TIGR03936 family radical SAM-associated protein [Slackia exigua]